jgi:cell wall-associated NlpC family hydrolase
LKFFYTLLYLAFFTTIGLNATSKIVKHSIKNGETLYAIAHQHHSTIKEVRDLNGIKVGETLKVGRVLRVVTNTYFPETKRKSVKAVSIKKESKKKPITKVAKLKKVQHKIKIVKASKKDRRANRILRKALRKHARPLASNRLKRHIVDDIIFTEAFKRKPIASASNTIKAKKITSLAKKELGKKYVWGATGIQNTFDCSGLTTYVYKKNGISLPRRAIAQSRVGERISRQDLKKGDLVFFDTSKNHKGFVNHVGIYIGDGKFIHASSAKKKVVITSLSKPFYAKRFKGGRRLASL